MMFNAINTHPTLVSHSSAISVRCPACGQIGTFDRINHNGFTLQDVQVTGGMHFISGQRICPNNHCRTLLFFVWDSGKGGVAITFPSERLDFDSTNIPESITKAMAEAITCHAHSCFIASAIMVRKTLEELCHVQGATGNSLKERIRSLGTKIVLPQELMEGLDDLRLLGNDAAHIESQEFNSVGKEEVEIGIEFAKEVLKAAYQYSSLLAKLRSLKRNP
jgi:hypothetical protein